MLIPANISVGVGILGFTNELPATFLAGLIAYGHGAGDGEILAVQAKLCRRMKSAIQTCRALVRYLRRHPLGQGTDSKIAGQTGGANWIEPVAAKIA